MVHEITAFVCVPAYPVNLGDDKDVKMMAVNILHMQVMCVHRFLFSVVLYNSGNTSL